MLCMLQSTAHAAHIFAMNRIFRAVPIDAVFAGYDGRGRGDWGREKLFSVIFCIYAGFLILYRLPNRHEYR